MFRMLVNNVTGKQPRNTSPTSNLLFLVLAMLESDVVLCKVSAAS